jgi:hypothetical protein
MEETEWKMLDIQNLHANIARDAGLPNVVWCRECGRSQGVDPGYCLAHGWPKCCEATMTIDLPTPTSDSLEGEER